MRREVIQISLHIWESVSCSKQIEGANENDHEASAGLGKSKPHMRSDSPVSERFVW